MLREIGYILWTEISSTIYSRSSFQMMVYLLYGTMRWERQDLFLSVLVSAVEMDEAGREKRG
jgi:hypothetical protein